jgi:6-hydroxytryprostatin B O-methyltransferase
LSLSGRISYKAHSFFDPQPVKDADVYLFRNVTHDWSNDDCTRILMHVVQILNPRARILIMDIVVPELGFLRVFKEHLLRACDVNMLQAFNHPGRSLQDWKAIISRVDGRL